MERAGTREVVKVTACPDDDTLAQLIEGVLDDARREDALEHVDTCSLCHAICAAITAGEARRLANGEEVGRYRIVEIVGRGAMGVVYRARDLELDRDVALKVVRADLDDEAASALRARLRAEARSLARVQSPNVVAVYEVGTLEGNDVFLAMELVDGPSLRAWCAGATPRSERDIVGAFAQAARGMAAAHDAGVIHRDFKPDNAIISRDGRRVWVGDFGLAVDSDKARRARRHDPGAGRPESPAGARRLDPGAGRSDDASPRRARVEGDPGAGRPESPAGARRHDPGAGRSDDASPRRARAEGDPGAGRPESPAGARRLDPGAGRSDDASPGRARVEGGADASSPGVASAAKRTAHAGTAAYFAPELLAGAAATPASDQYAFWISLVELVSAQPPLRADGDRRELPAGLSAGLRRLALRGLSADPQARWPTMHAVAAELDRLIGRRRPWPVVAFAALAAALAGAIVFAFAGRGEASSAQVCALGAERTPWTEARRATLAATLAGEAVVARAGRWAAAWERERLAACEPPSPARTSCLELVAVSAGTMLDVVAETTDRVEAIGIAGRLPDPTSCLAAEPRSAPMSSLEADLATRIAVATALVRAHRFEQGFQAADAIVRESAGLDAIRTRALLVRATAARDSGRRDTMEADLHAALALAVTRRDDAALADALVQFADAASSRDDTTFQLVETLASAALARQPSRELAARLDDHRCGRAWRHPTDLEAGRAICDRARANWLAIDPDSLDALKGHNALGALAYFAGRYDEAIASFRRLGEVSLRAFGPDHINVDVALGNEANAHARAGRFDEATRIIAAVRARRPDWGEDVLGMVAQARGETDDAVAHFTKFVAGAEQQKLPDDACDGRLGIAEVLADARRDGAAALADAARACAGATDAERVGRLQLARARFGALAGDRTGARTLATQALAQIVATRSPPNSPNDQLRARIERFLATL